MNSKFSLESDISELFSPINDDLIKILDQLEEIVVIQSVDGKIIYSNKYNSQSLNKDTEEIIGKFCFNLWGQVDVRCNNCPVAKAIKSRKLAESNISTPNDKHWKIKGIPIFNINNKVIGAIEIAKEISEEHYLKKDKEILKTIIEENFVLNLILNKDLTILESSSSSEFFKDEIIIGRNAEEIFPEKYTNILKINSEKTISKQSQHSFKIKRKERVYNACFTPLPQNKISLLLKDITDIHLAQESHQKAKNKLDSFSDIIPMTIFETNNSHYFTYLNKYGHETWGYTTEDIRNGIKVSDLLPTEEIDFFDKAIKESSSRNGVFSNQYNLINKEGRKIPSLVYYTTVFEDNIFAGMRGVVIDISQQKAVEKDLIAARKKAEEANKLKSTFLANISHEIRTPLNAILGLLQIIQNDDVDQETYNNFVEIINERSKELLSTINNIIEISLLESGQVEIQKEELNINEFFYELRPILNKKLKDTKKNSLDLIINAGNISITTDNNRLKQAFLKLFDNALKFTEKGFIKIETKTTEKYLQISITDTGPGINKETQESVFELFTKGRHEEHSQYYGTGLGLTITKKIVSLLKGFISLNSEKTQGCEFIISLPLNK